MRNISLSFGLARNNAQRVMQGTYTHTAAVCGPLSRTDNNVQSLVLCAEKTQEYINKSLMDVFINNTKSISRLRMRPTYDENDL